MSGGDIFDSLPEWLGSAEIRKVLPISSKTIRRWRAANVFKGVEWMTSPSNKESFANRDTFKAFVESLRKQAREENRRKALAKDKLLGRI